jgi:hypothetical protein
MACLRWMKKMRKKPDTNSNQEYLKLEIIEELLIPEKTMQRKII